MDFADKMNMEDIIMNIIFGLAALAVTIWTLNWFFSDPQRNTYSGNASEKQSSLLPNEEKAINDIAQAYDDTRRSAAISKVMKKREEVMAEKVAPEHGAQTVASWLREQG